MKQECIENAITKVVQLDDNNESNNISIKLEDDEEEKTRLKRRLRLQFSSSSAVEDSSDIEEVTEIINNSLYCKTCNYTYSSKELFLSHQIQIHPDEIPENYCQLCDRQYKTSRTYEVHNENAHTGYEYSYCHVCKRQYNTIRKYQLHMLKEHDTPIHHMVIIPDPNDPNFYCKACNHAFCSRKTFDKHLSNIHQMEHGKDYSNSGFKHDVEQKEQNTTDIFNLETFYGIDNKDMVFHSHKLNISSINYPFQSFHLDNLNINYGTRYCNLCRHTYSSEYAYRLHLFSLHNVSVKIPIRNSFVLQSTHSVD